MPVEYRVWVHPVKSGDDYYFAFKTPHAALAKYNAIRFSSKYAQVEKPITATFERGRKYYAKEHVTTHGEYAYYESSGRNSVDEMLGL